MEKKKSDSQAPDMSACRGCRHFFEAADPGLLQAVHPRVRIHTRHRAAQALPRRGRAARNTALRPGA